MSLFGTSWDDPKTAAIMGLAGGLLQGNAGEGLRQGLLGYQRQSQLNTQAKSQAAKDVREGQLFDLQKSEYELKASKAKTEAERDKLTRDTLRQAALDLQAGTFKPEKYAGVLSSDQLKSFAELPNWGRAKVERTAEVMGPNGQKQIVQLDAYGNPVGEGMAGYVPPQLVNLGDRQVFTTPQAGASFGVGMSPAERQRLALSAQSNDLARQRFEFDKQGGAAQPKLVDGQWVVPPRGMTPGQSQPAVMPTSIKEANEALALIRQAEEIIPKSTGSYAGAMVDQAGRLFGVSTEGDTAAAQLKALEGALISKMPKMSGPQSDKDVLLYKQMAGEIGDPTIPNERKIAALQVIKEIQQRQTGAQPQVRQPGTMGSGSFGMQPSGGWSIKPLP